MAQNADCLEMLGSTSSVLGSIPCHRTAYRGLNAAEGAYSTQGPNAGR